MPAALQTHGLTRRFGDRIAVDQARALQAELDDIF